MVGLLSHLADRRSQTNPSEQSEDEVLWIECVYEVSCEERRNNRRSEFGEKRLPVERDFIIISLRSVVAIERPY